MADPIITEAAQAERLYRDWADRVRNPRSDFVEVVGLALAQARADGRLAGMEEAAALADTSLTYGIASAIRARARTTKEG